MLRRTFRCKTHLQEQLHPHQPFDDALETSFFDSTNTRLYWTKIIFRLLNVFHLVGKEMHEQFCRNNESVFLHNLSMTGFVTAQMKTKMKGQGMTLYDLTNSLWLHCAVSLNRWYQHIKTQELKLMVTFCYHHFAYELNYYKKHCYFVGIDDFALSGCIVSPMFGHDLSLAKHKTLNFLLGHHHTGFHQNQLNFLRNQWLPSLWLTLLH